MSFLSLHSTKQVPTKLSQTSRHLIIKTKNLRTCSICITGQTILVTLEQPTQFHSYQRPWPILWWTRGSSSGCQRNSGKAVRLIFIAIFVVSSEEKQSYRFRLLAMSCEANFLFSIDGHDLQIIEADGVNVQPITVDSLQIFSSINSFYSQSPCSNIFCLGQRYSFVVCPDV